MLEIFNVSLFFSSVESMLENLKKGQHMFLPAVLDVTIMAARPLMPECSAMLNVRLELAAIVSVLTTFPVPVGVRYEISTRTREVAVRGCLDRRFHGGNTGHTSSYETNQTALFAAHLAAYPIYFNP